MFCLSASFLFLGAVVNGADYPSTVLADGPIAYWRFNDSGTVATNIGSLGAAADGTYTNGAVAGAEAPRPPQFTGFEADNMAAQLDGVDDFVVGVRSLLNGLTNVTMSAWIRRAGAQRNRTGLLGQDNVIEFGYIDNNTLQAWVDNFQTPVNVITPFPDLEWDHVALVVNGDALQMTTYTNGLAAGSAPLPSTNYNYLNNTNFFLIGGDTFGNGVSFNGQIDEAAVFDKALSAEQIAAHYFSAAPSPPIIIRQPEPVTVFEGATVQLSAAAVGSPVLQYQWLYFGDPAPLMNETNATLVISNAMTSHTGSYSLLVSNEFGTVESTVVDVIVNSTEPPIITQQPVSATRYAGLKVTFTVVATGGSNLGYQWQTNDVNLPGATNAMLMITNVQAANAGNYSVIVSNAAGVTPSDVAVLTVIMPPAGYASAIVAGNPLAYWRLDEAIGPTAFDYAGGFDGTYNGTASLGVPGALAGDENAAVQLDGATAYVGTPLQLNNMPNVTMVGWINREVDQLARTGLFGQNDLVEFGYIDNNTIQAWVDNFDTAVNVSPNPIPNQQWGQVALVLNSGTAIVYVNGSPAGMATLPSANYGSNGFLFNIGGGGVFDATGNYFNGRIDEVAVYNRALTANEICSLYTLGSGIQPSLQIERSGPFLLDTKPSGTPHPARNFGAEWVASSMDNNFVTREGLMTFAASEFDQIAVPPHTDFDTTSGTIMFWVRSAGTTGGGDFGAMLFDRRPTNPGGPPGDVIVQTDSGAIFVQAASGTGGANSFQTTRTINDDLWHHITYVYDQSATGSISLYIDGMLDASQTNSTAWSWTPSQQIELGRSHDPFWRAFNGSMDDVRIYNTMLTAAQIDEVYTGESGGLVAPASMVLRLNFDAAPAGLTLRWTCGILQEATTLVGSGPGTMWTDVAGATTPHSFLPTGQTRFFRLRQ